MLMLTAILQNPEIYEDAQLNKTIRSGATMNFVKAGRLTELLFSVINIITLIT